MKITGVILAGGKSKRMGTDKGLIIYRNKPLIEHSISFLQNFSNEIVISTNSNRYDKYGYSLFFDEISDIGPIGGIYSILKNCKSSNLFFIISCDMPHAETTLAINMINERGHYDIIVPILPNGKIEPLFGVYSRNILTTTEHQIESNNYKMTDLLNKCRTKYYNVPSNYLIASPDMFKNINKPNDVEI